MNKESILRSKSFEFAVLIINTGKFLMEEKKEYILSKQLIRSGTSIGALIKEGEFAQSKPDFISKLSIALKEANETDYWILLLRETNYLTTATAAQLLSTNKELISMLAASVKTLKNNLGK